ncbi:MAG: hypothetical protein KGQ70_07805 [Alphaproteobacteria bacterium]|nr:hypothetical protein [Alphaproteobacteria bacterium]
MTAPDRQSLAAAFNRAAADYRASFPERLGNLFVTLSSERIYVAPEIAALLAENAAPVSRMIAQRDKLMREMGWAAAAGLQDVGGARLRHLSLSEEENPRYVPAPDAHGMNKIAEFDHEMGHFVVREGDAKNPSRHAAECAADAFAALRHIQRFGGETGFFAHAPFAVAKSVIFGDKIHYVSAVFQKIAALQKEGILDIRALSLPETALLAGKLAREYALSAETLGRIHAAYAAAPAVRNSAFLSKDEAQAVMRVMLEHRHDDDVYRAGKLYISQAAVQKALDGEDPEVKEMRAEMARHEKETGFTPDAAAAMDKKPAANDPFSLI